MNDKDVVAYANRMGTFFLPLFALSFGVLSLLTFFDPSPPKGFSHGDVRWVLVAISATLTVPASVFAFWYGCRRLIASEDGLHWRDWHGWHKCEWEDIADYYFRTNDKAGNSIVNFSCEIRLTDGRTFCFGRDFHGAKEFMDRISERVGEHTNVPSWKTLGTRHRDFPQSFTYDAKALSRALVLPVGFVVTFTCLFIYVPIADAMTNRFDFKSILMIIFGTLFCSFFTAMLRRDFYPIYQAQGRIRDRFIVESEGFTFDDGREAVFVPWQTVIGYDFSNGQIKGDQQNAFQPVPPLRIRTVSGQEFVFYIPLKGLSRWMMIVRTNATNGIERRFERETSNALGGIAMRWSGGTEGVGDRIFSAYTRGARLVFVWLPIFLCLVIPSSFIINRLAFGEPLPWPTLLPAGLAVLIACIGVPLLKRTCVQLEETGVTYARPWKTDKILWGDIAQKEGDGSGADSIITLSRHDGTSVAIDTSFLAYRSQIAPLIDEHLRRLEPSLQRSDQRETEGTDGGR